MVEGAILLSQYIAYYIYDYVALSHVDFNSACWLLFLMQGFYEPLNVLIYGQDLHNFCFNLRVKYEDPTLHQRCHLL